MPIMGLALIGITISKGIRFSRRSRFPEHQLALTVHFWAGTKLNANETTGAR